MMGSLTPAPQTPENPNVRPIGQQCRRSVSEESGLLCQTSAPSGSIIIEKSNNITSSITQRTPKTIIIQRKCHTPSQKMPVYVLIITVFVSLLDVKHIYLAPDDKKDTPVLWETHWCCGRHFGVMEDTPVLWKKHWCCGRHTGVVEDTPVLWKTHRCCGRHTGVVEDTPVLWKTHRC